MSAAYRIAIIGAGPVGVALAKQLLRLGHSVTISNSRGPLNLREQEKATGVTAVETQSAVAQADIVFLAVPIGSITSLRPIFDASLRPDAIVIDSGNYYPTRDGKIKRLEDGMAETAWTAQVLSQPVIKVFNNIIAHNIVTSAKAKGSHFRVAMPVSGDDAKSKAHVMELVDQMGFDPYNAGSLADSWRQQPGTPAYCTEPTTAELSKLLASADRNKAAKIRDSSRLIFERLPSDYSPDTLRRVSRLAAGLDIFDLRTWVAAFKFLWAVIIIKLLGHT